MITDVQRLLVDGVSCLRAGRLADAVAAWEQALFLDPTDASARMVLDAVQGSPYPPLVPLPGRGGPPPPPADVGGLPQDPEELMTLARHLCRDGDLRGAVAALERVLTMNPRRTDAVVLVAEVVTTLAEGYEARLGAVEGVPHVTATPEQIMASALDPRSAFVLSQIDGRVTLDDLFSLCGMGRLETARTLLGLQVAGLIRVEPP